MGGLFTFSFNLDNGKSLIQGIYFEWLLFEGKEFKFTGKSSTLTLKSVYISICKHKLKETKRRAKNAVFHFWGIWMLRKEECKIGILNKDIILLISQMIWNTRNDFKAWGMDLEAMKE